MSDKATGSADRALGAAAVAGVFAAVGAGMGAVMWEFGINQTGGTFIVLWLLIFIVLMLGWRDLPPPTGGRKAPTAADHTTPAAPAAPAASQGESTASAGSSSATATAPAPSSGTAQAAAAATAAADTGTKPALLDGPREGKADDLKQLKGVGPALEKLCNSLGVYHFDQIATWTADEVAWVDEHLESFKGRVSRDDWVAQAKALVSGQSPKTD